MRQGNTKKNHIPCQSRITCKILEGVGVVGCLMETKEDQVKELSLPNLYLLVTFITPKGQNVNDYHLQGNTFKIIFLDLRQKIYESCVLNTQSYSSCGNIKYLCIELIRRLNEFSVITNLQFFQETKFCLPYFRVQFPVPV